jgi:hypothetical protein
VVRAPDLVYSRLLVDCFRFTLHFLDYLRRSNLYAGQSLTRGESTLTERSLLALDLNAAPSSWQLILLATDLSAFVLSHCAHRSPSHRFRFENRELDLLHHSVSNESLAMEGQVYAICERGKRNHGRRLLSAISAPPCCPQLSLTDN